MHATAEYIYSPSCGSSALQSEIQMTWGKWKQVYISTPAGDCICRAGIDLATVEVRMNQLKVEANIAVGSRGNPTVTNTVLNIADVRVSTQVD